MLIGTIARLFAKGFGFIKKDGVQYFFHRSAVHGASFDELREGMAVRFEEAATTVKGPRANHVEALTNGSAAV